MKKIISVLLVLILAVSLCSCGDENTVTDEAVNEEISEEATIVPDIVTEGSEKDLAVRAVVANYLNTFISCDFEAIDNILHEEDKWLFNFESQDQIAFYETILPKVEYEFEYVAQHEGVYGVMTRMSSPDMANVYGTLITEYLDVSMNNNRETLSEIVSSNTERMIELIASADMTRRDERLFIYVEYINGEYIPRCDMYLANELTGGAPEASDEITSTLSETLSSLME